MVVAAVEAAGVLERSRAPGGCARLLDLVAGGTGATFIVGVSTATRAGSLASGGAAAVAGLVAVRLSVTVSGAEDSPLVDKTSGPVNRCQNFTTLKPPRKKSP